jgi:hypothetical protein
MLVNATFSFNSFAKRLPMAAHVLKNLALTVAHAYNPNY